MWSHLWFIDFSVMSMARERTKTPLFIWDVPNECLWHLMWCPRISHGVKAHPPKRSFAETQYLSLLLSRSYTCHPHMHTSHSSCYLSAVQRIPGDEFIAVLLYVIHTRTYTTSHTWCLWKVLSLCRIPYVIMFDFRLYFNHYITFEICELRLYVSLPFHLPGLLISVIPSQHTCVQVFP